MNIDKKYVSYLVYFRQIIYEGVHFCYRWNEILDHLYWLFIYVPTEYWSR